MADASGQGWVQHLVHGTSKALVAAGPSLCRHGPGQRFFAEVKIFEVCRSIIFNEDSFLGRPEWRDLSVQVQAETAKGQVSPLDEMLEIILRCSALRSR
jgi:hypothetical protein